MSLKRRSFLLLTASLGGFCLTTLAHQAFTQSNPETVQNPLSKDAEAELEDKVRVVVISDLNSQYGSTSYEPEVKEAIAFIPTLQPDLVLCGGDMIASQKQSLSEAQIQAMWEAFDHHIAAPLRREQIPFAFTIGNHDGSGLLSSSGEYVFNQDREMAIAYWNAPEHHPNLPFIDRAHFPFYYTFVQNNIFYLVWDASTARLSAEQLTWVEKSLASTPAQEAKMRIAIGHLPLYAIAQGRDRPGEVLDSPDKLRSLLEQYHVHTYISGHHHAYYPGHRGELELLHAGALGGGPRQLLNSKLPPQKTLTLVEIDLNSEVTHYTTYDMKTLQVINEGSLPRWIVGHNGYVLRRDVSESEFRAKMF